MSSLQGGLQKTQNENCQYQNHYSKSALNIQSLLTLNATANAHISENRYPNETKQYKKEVETILLNVGVQFADACIYKPK